MASDKQRPNYQKIDGITLPGVFNPQHVREIINYKPKPEDVFIVTYPKCGTTWMQNIVLYIFRKGKELTDLELDRIHTMCPFIDPLGIKGIESMPRPGSFKTHFPYSHVPYSPDAKYIYVLRNPKDCCVSMYYHTKRAQVHGYGQANFDDFFELFIAGDVEYNDYFDHLASWYPHRHDKEVLFVTYEDTKRDPKNVVLKVASFLGQEYVDAIEQDSNVLNNILKFSGFQYMKTHLEKMFDLCRLHKEKAGLKEDAKLPEMPKGKEKIDFIRKGIVGDWKNHFSDEQSDRMNKKFVERTLGTDVYDMYKSYMGV